MFAAGLQQLPRVSKPTWALALVLALASSFDAANADDARPTSRRVVRHSERTARAAWTPTRSGERRTIELSKNAESRPNADRRLQAVEHAAELREVPRQGPAQPIVVNDPAGHGRSETVQTTSHEVPMPPASIVGGHNAAAVLPASVVHAPLDGQVVVGSPIVYGGSACDALPGGCGCGDSVCDGGCGFEPACGMPLACDGGCDSLGRGGCCSMCGELCSPNAWRPCVTLCLPQDGWATFEYLAWWQDGMDLPPLVTTSTDPAVAQAQAGVLGAGTTRVLYGGEEVLDDMFDGGRLNIGVWLDRCHTWGLGGEYFQIGEETEHFSATSAGNPVLARPFVNILNGGVEDSELVAFDDPNNLSDISGTVAVRASSELTGGGFNLRYLRDCSEGCSKWLFCGCPEHFCSRSEFLFGYRYLDLDESVLITEALVSTSAGAAGTFAISDSFRTRNQFNGVDLGWKYRRTRGYWTFDSTLRLAFGNVAQRVDIAGSTVITDPTATPASQTFNGGLLAQRGNIGRFEQDEFAVVPQIYVGCGYQLTDHIRAIVGYDFLYISNVIRPGGVIDRDLNTDLLPPEVTPLSGGLRPDFAFDTTDYWAQGISIGGEFRW